MQFLNVKCRVPNNKAAANKKAPVAGPVVGRYMRRAGEGEPNRSDHKTIRSAQMHSSGIFVAMCDGKLSEHSRRPKICKEFVMTSAAECGPEPKLRFTQPLLEKIEYYLSLA